MIPLTAAAGGVLYSVYYLMNNVTWIKGIGLIENVTRLESGPHCILLGHQRYLWLVKGKRKWKVASSHYEKGVENPFTNLPMIDSSMTCRELAEGDSFKVLRRVRRREVGEHVGDFESSAIRWRIKAALIPENRSINYVIGLQFSLLNGHLSKCDISYPGELREGFKIVIMNGLLLSGALRTRALMFDRSDLSLSGHQAERRFCEKFARNVDPLAISALSKQMHYTTVQSQFSADVFHLSRDTNKGSITFDFAKPFVLLGASLICDNQVIALPEGFLNRSKTLSLKPGGPVFLEMISPDALCELATD